MKALVLFSGGIDSTTTLYKAIEDGAESIMALTFNYGSLHNERERQSAYDILAAARRSFPAIRPYVQLLDPDLFKGAGSALMGEVDVPSEEYHDIEKETPSATIVPYRNGVMLSVAAALAVTHGYDHIYSGVHATDAMGWAYPDCTFEFWGAQANAIYVGTLRAVRVVTPYLFTTKAGVVEDAARMRVPAELTYSCYRGRQLHCGACPTCKERIAAFRKAGYVDPAAYEIPPVMDGTLWPTK